MPDTIAKQQSMKSIETWTTHWQMEISVPKCITLHIGASNPCIEYTLNDIKVPSAETFRDLGVLVSRNFKTAAHVSDVCAKGYKIVNLLFRCFLTDHVQSFVTAYKSYCRPIMEYASQVWSPSYVTEIDDLEKVQRYFTRRLFARATMGEVPYVERLRRLDLEPLELRRLISDLVMVYKILNNEVDLRTDQFFEYSNAPNNRGHSCRLRPAKHNTNYLKHSFSVRVIDAWNSLPACVNNRPLIMASNSTNFRKVLKLVNLQEFLKFDRNL